MAFFGITNLGYQNPIRDKLLVYPKTTASHDSDEVNSRDWAKQMGLPPTQIQRESNKCTDICTIYNQLPLSSQDIHSGSLERYREMLKRIQTPRSPNQLYSVPVTENQQYGWWNDGRGRMQESWAHVKRFPRKNSQMTKFVKEMSMTNREFRLF